MMIRAVCFVVLCALISTTSQALPNPGFKVNATNHQVGSYGRAVNKPNIHLII
ncbi:hypothetical protein Hanom_Chr10g00941581 [Helianthus anomalus]